MKPKEDHVASNTVTLTTAVDMNHADVGDIDDLSDDCDSPDDDNFDDRDLLAVACQDEVTAQLAAAGI